MNIAIILAAGKGKRFQSDKAKQYIKINGKEMFYYSYNTIKRTHAFDEVLLAVDKEEFNRGYIAQKYGIKCIEGGETRNKSIKRAISYIEDNYPRCEKIVFQDASRPFVSENTFLEVIKKLDKYDAVAVARKLGDALETEEGIHIDREKYRLIQTPEGFRYNVLKKIFDETADKQSIISQLGTNYKKYFVSADGDVNIKVCVPKEIFIAEQLYNTEYFSEYEKVISKDNIEDVLLLGGTGGIGRAVKKELDRCHVRYYSPNHSELDLATVTVDQLAKLLKFKPKVIINAAAYYANDSQGIIEHFDKIMAVNLKSNLVLIEYAKTLQQSVKIILLSSSSSTRGREGLTNYSASKVALNSIVSSLSNGLMKDKIYLNAIIPEKVNTPLIGKLHTSKISPSEMLNPETVVRAIMHYATLDVGGKLIHIRKGM